jgi:hypothetical protein
MGVCAVLSDAGEWRVIDILVAFREGRKSKPRTLGTAEHHLTDPG